MAAVFGAATRASFASIVFVFELTGDYKSILPLMLATVLADLVAAILLSDSLMTEKLSRRGLRVHSEMEVDALRTIPVRDVMSPSNGHVVDGSGAFVGPDDIVLLADETRFVLATAAAWAFFSSTPSRAQRSRRRPGCSPR